MAYKDKDRQREANRQAQARFKSKGITKGITIDEGITGSELIAFESLGRLSDMPKRTTDEAEYLNKRNADTRAKLAATPLAELKASKTWIPVWRDEQERQARI